MVAPTNPSLQQRAQALVDHVLDVTREPEQLDPRLLELRLRVLRLDAPPPEPEILRSVVVVIN